MLIHTRAPLRTVGATRFYHKPASTLKGKEATNATIR
jgi:hypothetical protein